MTKQPAARAKAKVNAYKQNAGRTNPPRAAADAAKTHQEARADTRRQEAKAVQEGSRHKQQAATAVVEKGKRKAIATLEAQRQARQARNAARAEEEDSRVRTRGEILNRKPVDDRVDLRPKPKTQAPVNMDGSKSA